MKNLFTEVKRLQYPFVRLQTSKAYRKAFMFQKLYHDFLRSYSPNPGKYTIGCTIKGPLSLIYRTFELYSTHDKYAKITNFISPDELSCHILLHEDIVILVLFIYNNSLNICSAQ